MGHGRCLKFMAPMAVGEDGQWQIAKGFYLMGKYLEGELEVPGSVLPVL